MVETLRDVGTIKRERRVYRAGFSSVSLSPTRISKRPGIRKGTFLVLTSSGIEFVKKWFKKTGRVPSEITRLYQLLLKTAMMGGAMAVTEARRAGYRSTTIRDAMAKNFLSLKREPEPSREVKRQIKEFRGNAPEQIYT